MSFDRRDSVGSQASAPITMGNRPLSGEQYVAASFTSLPCMGRNWRRITGGSISLASEEKGRSFLEGRTEGINAIGQVQLQGAGKGRSGQNRSPSFADLDDEYQGSDIQGDQNLNSPVSQRDVGDSGDRLENLLFDLDLGEAPSDSRQASTQASGSWSHQLSPAVCAKLAHSISPPLAFCKEASHHSQMRERDSVPQNRQSPPLSRAAAGKKAASSKASQDLMGNVSPRRGGIGGQVGERYARESEREFFNCLYDQP